MATPSEDGPASTVDWDADGYARLSTPQQSWGREVLARLHLAGDETVLDLGCGAGLVTEQLVALVPRGRVVAVDASADMARATKARGPGGRRSGRSAGVHLERPR
jgi:trans-aconitate 2-methyltransferase